MKELEVKAQEKTENVAQAREVRKENFIGSSLKIKGLRLWEFNPKTMDIQEAQIEVAVVADFTPTMQSAEYKTKVIINEGCNYVQALNKKNAVKKFTKHYMKILDVNG